MKKRKLLPVRNSANQNIKTTWNSLILRCNFSRFRVFLWWCFFYPRYFFSTNCLCCLWNSIAWDGRILRGLIIYSNRTKTADLSGITAGRVAHLHILPSSLLVCSDSLGGFFLLHSEKLPFWRFWKKKFILWFCYM
jgi:hypothetical protein